MKMISLGLSIAACLFAAPVFAENRPAASESKELALPDFSKVQNAKSGSSDGIHFSTSVDCKTTDGQTYKSGDTGFDSCMMNNGSRR